MVERLNNIIGPALGKSSEYFKKSFTGTFLFLEFQLSSVKLLQGDDLVFLLQLSLCPPYLSLVELPVSSRKCQFFLSEVRDKCWVLRHGLLTIEGREETFIAWDWLDEWWRPLWQQCLIELKLYWWWFITSVENPKHFWLGRQQTVSRWRESPLLTDQETQQERTDCSGRGKVNNNERHISLLHQPKDLINVFQTWVVLIFERRQRQKPLW